MMRGRVTGTNTEEEIAMRRLMQMTALTAALALGCGLLSGCEGGQDTGAAKAGAVTLCGCGYEKGAESCCNAELPKCGGCGKIKGSPGCCK